MGTKYIADDEQVLNSYTIKGVGSGQRGAMDPVVEQKPNTRFLWSGGPAHLVGLYEFGKKNFLFKYDSSRIAGKKEKIIRKFDRKIEKTENQNKERRLLSRQQRKVAKKDRALIEGNQLMRWGEKVVVYDSVLTASSMEGMGNFLNSRGFYANKISVETETKGKNNQKIDVTYMVDKGPAYIIDSIEYEIPDWRVKELIMSFQEDFVLKTGVALQQPTLSQERDRIYELMVNRGYYEFSKDLVYFEIDSVTLGNQRLIVKETIASPRNQYYHKKYVVDSVIFVTDAGASTAKNIPDETFNLVTYNYGRFKYSPRILDWHNQLYPGKIYRRNTVMETQRQLSYLDNFKFINVNFDTLGNKFVAHVFTSPADKYQTSTETGFSVTQGLPGPFANINVKNRNLFNGLEITEINGYFKLEGNPGVTDQDASYSSVQYGGDISVTVPQFLTPLGRFYKKRIAKYNPRTRFGLAFNKEDRLDNYNRSTFTANASYIWKVEDHISYVVSPAMVSYINSVIDPEFQEVLDELSETSPSFASTFQSSFVSAGSMQIIVNDNYGVSRNSDYLQFYLEFGGHLLSLFGQDPFGDGLEYFNYTKANLDLRRLHSIHSRLSVAMRFNMGIALPYGNNNALPYEKYFFAGGSNSIRAWRPRRLGPGAYGIFNGDGTVNYDREQPADLLLESSIELRQKLSGFIDGAFFIDAGNIWNISSQTVDPDEDGDDGSFDFGTFYKEFAVGAGVGIRFDMSFLIFRLDLGWKFVDPAQPLGKRWVASKIFPRPFSTASYNIGIGYPF